jgi:lipopolysaccharide heptosyltransferase II
VSEASPRRILVRAPNWVGDVVMASPALRALRRAHPEAEIDVAIRRYAAPLLRGWQVVDGLVELDPALGSGFARVRRTARLLRTGGYEAALLLTNSFGTALEARLAGIPRRLGYAGEGRRWLLTDSLPRRPKTKFGYREPEPMVESYLRAAALLGADAAAADRRYEVALLDEDRAWVEAWAARHGLPRDRPWIGINPGAKFGSSKLWAPERFAAAADGVVRATGGTALLLGGPGEEPLLAEIAAHMREEHFDSGAEIVPLGPLRALVDRLAILLTTDTGTRAIAQACGTPDVTVMGSTHPGWTDSNLDLSRVIRHDVDCGPCHQKTCPLAEHHCMNLVTVDEVVAAAQSLLRRPRRIERLGSDARGESRGTDQR